MNNNDVLKQKYMALISVLHALNEYTEDRLTNTFGLFIAEPKEISNKDILDIKTIFDNAYKEIVNNDENDPRVYLKTLDKLTRNIKLHLNIGDA